jgi:hypothetical protein
MDELIECGRCGGNACYAVEVSPEIKNYWCYGCGFISNSVMKIDSEFLKEQMEMLPDLYKALMVEDEEGKVWMPSTVNILDKGMVFASGNNALNWRWASVKATPVLESEQEKYKLKDGTSPKWRMDMTTQRYFEEKDYIEALSFIGVLPE